jgi:hypothetical protein
VFPAPPTKTVTLDWTMRDPGTAGGSSAEREAAFEQTYQNLRMHIGDLARALLGE